MSDAILAFQSQLSGVMETVFKAAMYEITRLVEDSFLEEVSRSREQVESLKQRLQWSESRRREREGGGRVRCVPTVEELEFHTLCQVLPRLLVSCLCGCLSHAGADESRGLKQEKVLEGAWSSCPGNTAKVGECRTFSPSTPQIRSCTFSPGYTPSPITAPQDMSSQMSQQTHVDGDRLDAMLKEEGMQAAPPPDHLQERWSVCLEGQEGPEGEEPDRAFGEQRLQLCEEEWGPGAGMGADPGRDGSAEELARAYSARYGVEEELGAALEAESKGEYMVAMLSGSGELDGRSLEDSLLRADGQLNFPAELDPTNSTAEAATHPFGPRGRRPSLGDPQGSPPGDSNVGELDCLLINEDGYLQDTDGRYRGPAKVEGTGQRGAAGSRTQHRAPAAHARQFRRSTPGGALQSHASSEAAQLQPVPAVIEHMTSKRQRNS
ncbi:hypothetical protein AGOR_G00195270 [Albula goreensis]|uniref:Uncharacterized protein n=1 Tax=Albula goreensis TaxID=1534307 RepID=A0A8T3CW89_9TELE|nr:hypothetical protein AGOR_G00195270 [Albula goreensis]